MKPSGSKHGCALDLSLTAVIVGFGRIVVRFGYLGRVGMGWVVRSSWSGLVIEVGLIRLNYLMTLTKFPLTPTHLPPRMIYGKNV